MNPLWTAVRSRLTFAATGLAILIASGITLHPQSSPMTIVLTGQSMIRSDLRSSVPAAMPTIASLLKGDVIFTNAEGTIAEQGQPNETTPEQGREGSGFLAPPEAYDALKAMGFNLVSLANNHSWNLRAVGIQNAIRSADRVGLAHAGTGKNLDEAVAPGYLKTPKGTVALVAMASGEVAEGGAATPARPGVNELRVTPSKTVNLCEGCRALDEDGQRILASIRTASKQADLVIAYQHNHIYDVPFQTAMNEELPERLVPPPWIKQWTHAEVDAGADIVVMHGAPLLQGVEIYKGRPIFYDMGNFIFNFPALGPLDEPIIWEGAVANVEFQGKNLQSITFTPIVLNKIGQGGVFDMRNPRVNPFRDTRGLPKPATGEQARYILERLAGLSRPFGTDMQVSGETATIKLKAGR
jgi:poly-gamma-glutamate synthesis protein (capsule biosynthesis protein)